MHNCDKTFIRRVTIGLGKSLNIGTIANLSTVLNLHILNFMTHFYISIVPNATFRLYQYPIFYFRHSIFQSDTDYYKTPFTIVDMVNIQAYVSHK